MQALLQKTEQALSRWAAGFDRALLAWCAGAAALGMLLAHGFAFFNLFPNHDSTVLVFDAQWTMYTLGRWVQNFYFPLVRGTIAAPWLVGIFTTVFLAAAGYCIAKILQLPRKAAALQTAMLATCASMTALLATYNFEADVYTLAMLLACLGVWFVQHPRHPRAGFVAGAVCFCLTLGIYQSYIEFAVGLFLLSLLCRALGQNLPWAAYLRQGLRAVASLCVGGVLYAVTVKISLALTGYQLADTGNGLGQLLQLGPLALLGQLPAAVGYFFNTMLGYNSWNDRAMRVATALLLALGLLFVLAALRRCGWRGRTVAQAALALLLLPLGLNVVYLLVGGHVYALMYHAFFLAYALPLALCGGGVWQNTPRPRLLCRWAVGVLCGFLIVRNVIFANGAYTYTKLMYENTASQLYTIMAQVEALPGYEPGVTPVAFVGSFTESDFAYQNPNLKRYTEGDTHQVTSGVTYDGTILWWFRNVMGSTANVIAQQGELDAVAADARVQALPSYPSGGYCAMVDGVAVVKISD